MSHLWAATSTPESRKGQGISAYWGGPSATTSKGGATGRQPVDQTQPPHN